MSSTQAILQHISPRLDLSKLSIQQMALSIGGIIAISYVWHLIYNLFFHPLAKVPSYSTFASANTWWSLYTGLVTQDKLFRIDEAHRTIGPVLRCAPNEVIVNDLGTLKTVMNARLDKTDAGAAFTTNRGVPNAFSAVTNAEAAGKRKGMLPQYSTANLQEWQPVFEEHIPQLINVLRAFGPDKATDILSLSAHTLIDILGEIVLDDHINALEDYAKGVENSVVTAILMWPKRGVLMGTLPPPLWWAIEHFPFKSKRWNDIVNSDSNLADFVGPRVKAAQAGPVPERIALAHRLSASFNAHIGSQWPTDHVISECIDHFLAGTATTAMTVSFAMYLLSIHPEDQAALQAELDASMPESDVLLDISTLRNLPFLNAVIKEALRLYPASPAAKLRILKTGLVAHGTYLPPGTVVGTQIWSTHRSTEVWGPDAHAFRPSRWLEELSADQRLAFQPFSIGGRSCPGNNLAMVDLRYLTSMIARNFTITTAKETTPASMEIRELETIYPVGGAIKLHFTPR